jgi:hypothetical protein
MRIVTSTLSIVVCLGWLLVPSLMSRASGSPQQAPRANSSSSSFDGPAELPRIFVKSSLADTPAPGRVLEVKEGDNLQQALDHASCGDTIRLQAGAAFRGLIRVPAKNCDDSHWIIIRSSASNSALPPEGTRVTPCYAGVDSLPGRPPFHCSSTKNVLAKLVASKGGTGSILITNGANHYRFLGLEITRETGALVNNLVSLQEGRTAHHLVFDRVWMHGTAQDETRRGIFLGASTYVAVVDSFFSDFHCTAVSGGCVDSQAILGGLGDQPMGPYKVVNNFLEAAAESILFGGGPATLAPADIEIRHNHMFKPRIWQPGNPQFIGATDGHPFIVKNLFELKNAQRVLLEGNVMENTWGGFTQTGFGVVLTPKNQSPNLCPLCQVTDVTIRYCTMSHMASGFQISNVLSDTGGASKAGEHYSIHDVAIDDIQADTFKGFGIFAQVSTNVPTLHDVKIDHITAFPPKSLFLIGGPPKGEKMYAFSFTNSIITAGTKPIMTTGGGPQRTCSAQPESKGPARVFADCFSSYALHHNAIIGGGDWPKDNRFPKKVDDVRFADFNGGNQGDYRLLRTSPFKGAATDGKDLGADIDAINARTTGVR